MSEWYNHSYNFLWIFCYFLHIFPKLYMQNSVLLLFTVDKPEVKLYWWQHCKHCCYWIARGKTTGASKGPANCKLLLTTCDLLPVSSDLLLATTASCHLLLSGCQLLLASCYTRFFFFFFLRGLFVGFLRVLLWQILFLKMSLHMSLKCVLFSILLRATERKFETVWHVHSTCCIRALPSTWRVCKNFVC